jgi:4-hydroxythreonine-4-phosphate dehydrogenase
VKAVTQVGITIGDPAGIGPEIVAATLATAPREWLARITVYGDRGPLERGAAAMRVDLPADLRVIESGQPTSSINPGSPNLASGGAQVHYLETAVAAAANGELAAIVTAPISKTWARRAGFEFLGHTEMLAARLHASDVAMFFVGPKLRVALATVHRPLAEVVQDLSTDRVRSVIELVVDSMIRDLGVIAPRIGVVGLNPHAGEDGLLGDEDADIIAPALLPPIPPATLVGPLVPDAAFRDAVHGRYDALIAMYHDQGLIPVKLIDFDESVNVTLGLPIVRTSPDHGTAYDIAGKGIARSISMQRALALAIEMVGRRSAAR